LQPCFANSHAAPADAGSDGDIDDLLFSRVSLTAPGLGATAQPILDEVSCAVEAGDRLLLMATRSLVDISPEILVRGLALVSRDDASRHIATAAGLGADSARWPLAIIEIDA
jgi:type VI secretion system protein ImpM